MDPITDEMVELFKRTVYFHMYPDATEADYLNDADEGNELNACFRAGLSKVRPLILKAG